MLVCFLPACCLGSSEKKLKTDGKLKKAKHEDHLKHIPFRLREIMKSKERMSMGSSRRKKMKKGVRKTALTFS